MTDIDIRPFGDEDRAAIVAIRNARKPRHLQETVAEWEREDGRPALANPHWPVWAARELAHNDPFSLIPQDWSWWLRNRPGPEGSLGWPAVARGA